MDRCMLYARMAYIWLPLFLAVVAASCLLITTLRRMLTGGIAASLSALAGVVVVAAAFVAAHHVHATEQANGAAQESRTVHELTLQLERLHGKVAALEARLAAKGTGAMGSLIVPTPPEQMKPVPSVPPGTTPPPVAQPAPKPEAPPTPPPAGGMEEAPR